MVDTAEVRCPDLLLAAVRIAGEEHVRADLTTRDLHSYDASLEFGMPELIVTPGDGNELRALIAAAYRHGVPFVMRGAGTGYSGGALPARGGMLILTSRLNRIIATDFEEGWIRCEPGVVLATVQQVAEGAGWQYLPDPSSHQVCTIGGNVAENAGGPHALGGGPTSNYVSEIELVRPDGNITTLSEQGPWDGNLDLRSVVVGSEGTLGAISSVTLRLTRAPDVARVALATFAHPQDALRVVTDTFDIGLLPSAMDMLTGGTVPGHPDFDDPSLLFIGLQGLAEEVSHRAERIERSVRAHDGKYELLDIPRFLPRRAELVRAKVRRMVTASGCPRYYLFDAVAPRSSLARLMAVIQDAAEEFRFPILNTFHAGDGNVHPTAFYDPAEPDYRTRLMAFSTRILGECRRLGGSLSGEHGIGLEKRALMHEFFTSQTLTIMRKMKRAFDPADLSNPAKILPDIGQLQQRQRPAPPSLSRRSARLHVDRVDALIHVGDPDPAITFAEIDTALSGSPYELPYEPIGATYQDSALAAIDAGLPGIRDAGPAYVRDLILGTDLQPASTGATVRLGGRSTKDVAGYELRKLVYGGRGRLGNLTGVRLRLLPRTSDSRLAQSMPMALSGALALCRRVHAAGLPFAYLGVLLTAQGIVTVTGRLELRGGVLDRHIAVLRSISSDAPWDISLGDRWTDPVMCSLGGGTGHLAGTAGMPWATAGLLQDLVARRTGAFASIGHRRTWWPDPAACETSPPPLTAAVIDAFGGLAP